MDIRIKITPVSLINPLSVSPVGLVIVAYSVIPGDSQAAIFSRQRAQQGKFYEVGDVARILVAHYVENDEPHPQLFVECGLMKLKAWRISVSS